MRENIIKIVIMMFIIIGLEGCSSKSSKGTYTSASYVEPLRYDKDNGGHLVVIIGRNETDYSSYRIRLNDDENNKEEQIVFSSLPYIAYWRIARNPLGMKPDYSVCGERPQTPEYSNKYSDSDWDKIYSKHMKEWVANRECTDNVTESFDSKTVYRYYYAKMREDHKIRYPKKSEMYYRWNINYYIGGVNDLAIEAVPDKYKSKLDELRSHKCHKWGASANHTCYDLPNGDKNIYYGLREEQYIIEDGKRVPKNRYPMDVRISEPIDWVEIEGIEINKDMYDYLERGKNRYTFFMHFNEYKGELTEEQREYIEAVKWDKDRVYEEKK